MSLYPLDLPPGMYQNGTAYQAKGRWYTGNLVRWRDKALLPVGGWTPLITSSINNVTQSPAIPVVLSGVPRGIVNWLRTGGRPYLGIGTHSHLYAYSEGALQDITPAGFIVGQINASSTAGGTGLYGKGFYGSGPYGTSQTLLGHTVDPDVWQLDTFGDFLVGVMAPSDGTLYIWDPSTSQAVPALGARATGTLTASGVFSDTETVNVGGKTYTLQSTLTNVDGHVKIAASTALTLVNLLHAVNASGGTPGADYAVATTANALATAGSTTSTTLILFAILSGSAGNTVVTTETCANAAFGSGTLTGGADGAPIKNAACVVTPERFLVALGAGGDPRIVQWASQETTSVWNPATAGSTAGQFPLSTTGRILAGRRGNNETLIWTDVDLYRMTYIGGTLVYGFDRAGDSCGLIGPNALASAETFHAWMGSRSFFTYNGYVADLPCDVLDGVFSNFNFTQRAKVAAFANVDYGEITWYYPSASSSENDSYVTWNYRDNWWALGQLPRTCGASKTATFKYPILCDASGNVYQHEIGFSRGGLVPFAQSGPIEVGVGEKVFYANYLYPDDRTIGDVEVTFSSQFYPDGPATSYGPFSLANPTPIRFAGRQTRMTVTEVNAVDWRVGTLRLDGTLGGTR